MLAQSSQKLAGKELILLCKGIQVLCIVIVIQPAFINLGEYWVFDILVISQQLVDVTTAGPEHSSLGQFGCLWAHILLAWTIQHHMRSLSSILASHSHQDIREPIRCDISNRDPSREMNLVKAHYFLNATFLRKKSRVNHHLRLENSTRILKRFHLFWWHKNVANLIDGSVGGRAYLSDHE